MKRKAHLAVFENVSETRTKSRKYDIIDDDDVTRPRAWKKSRKITREVKTFVCKYNGCCEEFNDHFNFHKHLTDHIRELEDEDVFTCEYGDCDFKPLNRIHALQHISYHGYHDDIANLGDIVARRDDFPECTMDKNILFPANVENYICEWDECGMNSGTFFDYLCHVKMHVNGNPSSDKEKNIKCMWKYCSKRFRQLNILAKHVRVHTGEKYIACSGCGARFATLVRYSDHRSKQIPIDKQTYKCSQCSKHFATENLLKDHVRRHINQYKCSMCDMTCPKPSNLAVHIRYRHLNDRPYKCNLCDHASISKQNLEQHLMTHCAEKLLACDECDFKCRSMYGLDKHLQNEHGQNYEQIFECHLCKSQFKRGALLTKHLMKAHGVQWPSGHSRYRYKEDPDGIFRLQTIRYETVDVIREILKCKTEPPPPPPKKIRCRIIRKEKDDGGFDVETIIEEVSSDSDKPQSEPKKKMKTDFSNILLTISDLDDDGNVLSQVTEAQKVVKSEN